MRSATAAKGSAWLRSRVSGHRSSASNLVGDAPNWPRSKASANSSSEASPTGTPDPNRAIDLERLRTRGLLREFAAYHEGRGRLKQFRTEAVRAGFAHAWREKDYATIVRVAERLPESVLQEDPDLLMYYDNASLRVA